MLPPPTIYLPPAWWRITQIPLNTRTMCTSPKENAIPGLSSNSCLVPRTSYLVPST